MMGGAGGLGGVLFLMVRRQGVRGACVARHFWGQNSMLSSKYR